ncbi:MAG TPA: alpha/beta hydrolase [Candidatus Dormibacteraeota bacterium]|jgi:acetyl esterase/lipase|nr:alpha/beta hydrolase [Candidatus Dormibacteraeota bacterium]
MPTVRPATTDVEQKDIDEARAFNTQLEALIATQPPVYTLPPDVSRQTRREGKGIFPAPVFLEEARDIEIAGRGGPIKVRIIRPDRMPTGIYLHLHGGGWTLGAHDMQDAALKLLANETGLCAASIDYRLAPENPYPAGPDDCEDAVLHLLEHGAQQLDAPARFAIGGESAGAHLAVVTLLRLRDRHGISNRIAAANLVFGAYDMNGTPSQILWGDRNLVLSTPIIRWFGNNFLPGVGFEQRRDPDISPLYARLDDMPPALFAVGTMDSLIDDSLFMSERWRAAGNRADVAVYPEGVHGFNAFPTGLARKANARQFEFLRTCLA